MAHQSLRIIHVATAHTWRGGEHQVLELSARQMESGHTVVIACQPNGELAQRALKRGVRVRPIRMRGEWDLIAARAIGRLVSEERAQVVHAHTAHAHTLSFLAVRRNPTVKLVVSRRVDFGVGGNPLSRWKYLARVDAYVTVSKRIGDVLQEAGVGPERLYTVHDGIDLQLHRRVSRDPGILNELGLPDGTRILTNVAALTPEKDHITLVRAMARIRNHRDDVRLLILGEGEMEEHIRREVSRLSLEDEVLLLGFREDVLPVLAAADVFVLPSYQEGLGSSLLDAMVLGIPIVATQTGGIPEIVHHGRNGLLVPPRSAGQLASAVLRLLGDDALREYMGREAREMAEMFSIDRTVADTENVYRRLLSNTT